jgi:DNA-binding response OmpR family regulator
VRSTNRVLVIEDSHSVGALLTDALEQEGCDAVLARTADEGVDLAQSLRPDVVAVDLAHASDVVNALRTAATTRNIPIIAISAPARDLDPALLGQLTRVFGEPFYPSDVVAAILETLHLTASSSAPPATRH